MRAPRAKQSDGFVLIVVLWSLIAIAVLALLAAQATRLRTRDSRLAIDQVIAGGHAQTGVNVAILDLIAAQDDQQRPRRFPVDGQISSCRLTDGAILTVSVRDEAGKIDLNVAGERLLRAFFTGMNTGDYPMSIGAMVDRIIDFRDSDDLRKPEGAESADYRAAGRPGLPRNGPFETVEELVQVLGFTPDLVARLRPFLTVHSGQAAVDVTSAPAELLDALAAGGEDVRLTSAFGGTGSGGTAQRAYTIRVGVALPTGTLLGAEALVVLRPPLRPEPFQILRWRQPISALPTGTATPADCW